MESWKIITYNVAVYMFFFEIRPLDTYLTAYLTGPDGNVSLSEVLLLFIYIIHLPINFNVWVLLNLKLNKTTIIYCKL